MSKGQSSIPKSKVARAISLMGAGAKVSGNYLRYYGEKVTQGEGDRQKLHQSNAEDTYATLSHLKGGPLKVAQMLSIDKAMLPEAYAKVYSQAQYSAPPLSFPLVVKTFRREMGLHPDEIFDTFTRQAVSGASIGQVHKASKGSQNFAVKIQYPGVADSMESDLRLIRPIAMRLFQVTAQELDYYMEEVKERLLEETDYNLELKRALIQSRACAHLPHTFFPKFYEEFSSDKILTMEWVDGEPLDRFADQNISQEIRDRIGQALWDFYHYQVHELLIFHADPHPGNFLIRDNQLGVLDFGCVKQLDRDFHDLYFRLLDPTLDLKSNEFDELLRALDLILPSDSSEQANILTGLFSHTVDLLGRPFKTELFDFGDESYLAEIREFSEQSSRDQRLKKMSSARGSKDALYLNRTYFGLYGLLNRLGARIRARVPDYLVA